MAGGGGRGGGKGRRGVEERQQGREVRGWEGKREGTWG